MPTQNLVETHNLTKEYGKVRCVNSVNMQVKPGTIYGFLGPNGAGKSTTLKMILGLAKPTAGSITLFGTPVNEKNRIKLLTQTGSLIESPSKAVVIAAILILIPILTPNMYIMQIIFHKCGY